MSRKVRASPTLLRAPGASGAVPRQRRAVHSHPDRRHGNLRRLEARRQRAVGRAAARRHGRPGRHRSSELGGTLRVPRSPNFVDGLSKLDRLDFRHQGQNNRRKAFTKCLLAMARDAARHPDRWPIAYTTSRTLAAVALKRARRIARGTLEIYAPIAHRLGLNLLFRELQDLCTAAMYPNRYQVLYKAVGCARQSPRSHRQRSRTPYAPPCPPRASKPKSAAAKKRCMASTPQDGGTRKIPSRKSWTSMASGSSSHAPECYLALGTLHQLYRPVPGKF